MSKRKYMVRAECPQCACGDVSFLGPEKLREKFIGDEKEIEILCPFCGTKHKGEVGGRGCRGRLINCSIHSFSGLGLRRWHI